MHTIVPVQSFSDLRLWFLTGSQALYGERAIARVAEQSREVAVGLDTAAEIPIAIEHRPVLTTPDAIRRTCIEASAEDECIGVIVWMHTFSPAKMWIGGLSALTKPLLHLHTQFNRSLPWAEIDMDFMNLNQSAHGDREFGHIATRLQLPRKVVVGHWTDSTVHAKVASWSRAAAGAHEARNLSVIRFGDNMREVAVTEGDKVAAQQQLGIGVNTYPTVELTATVDAQGDADVDALAAEYERVYDVVPELSHSGDRHGSLRDAARIELGLRAFLTERGAAAFTDTFEDLAGLRQLPGLPVQRMMADGYGFGGEGDWKTAALVRICKAMAQGLPGGTSFMEDYTYHLGPGEPLLLGSHMLEVCPSIAAATPTCEIHPLSIGAREDPVRLVFTAAPGPAIQLGLLDLGERFRLIANQVDAIEPEHDLPRLPVARALWRPEPDLATATECWILSGGPHHAAFTAALDMEAIVDLAEMLTTELVVIDASSTARQTQQELRWNAAYHRLAAPL